jgi:hypothetical protein
MINSRQKGKRGERYFATELKAVFPNIRRNAGTQSQSGGVDLENTEPFNFEVKCGKDCQITKVRKWLDQVEGEGKSFYYNVVLVKPDREEPFVVMPFDDFEALLEILTAEGILKSKKE